MAKKSVSSIGIEFDNFGIRAARITSTLYAKNNIHTIEQLEEQKGNFVKEEDLVAGLVQIKEKLAIGARDRLVTCVSGKQVYAVQIPFRKLPEAEIANAVRFEIRKNLPFEIASSSLDFQVLDSSEEGVTLMVTVVANQLLHRLLRAMGRAGIKPWIVDVMPVAVANAFWAAESDQVNITAHVITHFSHEVCTVVIDGNTVPFYTRSIYFNAGEIFGGQETSLSEREIERRLSLLGDELRRSLAFYEKTYNIANFGAIYLMGDYIQSPALLTIIQSSLGLTIKANLLLKKIRAKTQGQPGRFDVAIALAMRTDQVQATTR